MYSGVLKFPTFGFGSIASKYKISMPLTMLALSMSLSACQQGSFELPSFGLDSADKKLEQAAPKPIVTAQPQGEVVGSGATRIALLVPKSATGGAGIAGRQIARAAKLALRDFGSTSLQLVIKDTKGDAAKARALASQAVNEGASLVLGPLFSQNVSTASAITKQAKTPMIAFSSDSSRAGSGVYLLSFAPEADIARTINYGISLGASRIVAALPQSAYGDLAERELKRVVAASGGTITAIIRYKPESGSIAQAGRSVTANLNAANAVYIPEGGAIPGLIIKSIKSSGGSLSGQQLMGSGQWETVNKRNPAFNGAVYAGSDKRNFGDFVRRYRAAYGVAPIATAGLGYDAVSLSAELVRRNARQPFSAEAIQSVSGFNGVGGLFRFRKNGRLQRGLVVNQINNGSVRVVSPAPQNFGSSG